jgi:RNA polymerase sigma-70 factor (ECF subfamily)
MKMHQDYTTPGLANADSSTAALAFEQLFKKHHGRLVYFSFLIVKDQASAEDITQEAFITYWNQRHEVAESPAAVKSFLYRTVRNASLNVVRHQHVVAKYEAQHEAVLTEEKTIVNFIIQSEVLSEIYRAIASLPPGCQQISRLGFLEGKKNQEIAEELGISINTVKTQKQRALHLLRLRLKPEAFSFLLLFMLE